MTGPRADRVFARLTAAACAACCALPLAAQPAVAGAAEPQSAAETRPGFAVRAGTLHLGTGEVLHDAVMIVHEGRIEALGAGKGAPEIPAGMRVIDAAEKVVVPGLVAADSNLSGHSDSDYNVTPDFVALDGFDFVRERPHLLSGGVTTVWLSPARSRLVSGQGSVVKLHGDDLSARVLSESGALRIAMNEEVTDAPAVFEPTPTPTSDDPLRPARKQLPSSRISMLPALRKVFADAAGAAAEMSGSNGGFDDALFGPGPAEERYSIRPLLRVLRGDLPLRIAAHGAADIRRALQLVQDLGARGVLEDPWEVAKVAHAAADAGVAAVFRIPVRPGASNPGGEDLEELEEGPQPQLEAPAAAARAGMRIALAAADDQALADFLVLAGLAVRHGLGPAQAMRAVTTDAAAVIGVADRVGSLEPGKDADFVVLSGEPFAIGSLVEQTWIDGELAWERETDTEVLAVRAGTIHTLAGNTVHDGVLVAQDGKIKAIGEDLSVPYGARVIDLGPDSVMVPGFIDSFSHAGLSGKGTGVPQGSADQHVAAVVRPDDPVLREAARAGLTTVLVSGKDAGTVSGRVAAVKTAGADRDSMVLKDTAAIRFVHDALGAEAIKPLQQQLERGKKYLEAWQKYEKALEKYEKGEREEPPEEAESTEPEAEADPLSGTWVIEPEDTPIPVQIGMQLRLEGSTVTGSVRLSIRGREMGPIEIENGTFEDDVFEADVRMPPMGEGHVEATVGEDTMEGTLSGGPMTIPFRGTRTSKPGDGGATATDAGSDEPKKPKVDESLEPLKALFEKRIPAVVRTDKAPAIRDVVELFVKEELPLILTGAKDVTEDPGVLGDGERPGVLLGPAVVEREGTEVKNAAARLTDAGVTVAMGTGDTAGSRFLPLHASMAVRYGLDPNTALASITSYPARLFKIDDRVGSLERGKDADFVVFDGKPFDVTSRVRLVVIDGRVVVDERETR